MQKVLKRLLIKALGSRRMHSLRSLIQSSAIHSQRPCVRQPESCKIVVLAPHMDDEVLCCGGTIARHIQAGAQVAVIFLTDGRHGGRAMGALAEHERERRQQQLVATRKREARRAGAILGVQNIFFLDAEDGRLRADAGAAIGLRAILEREQPRVVYLPFLLENHVDHRAASDMLMVATAATALDVECRCYEVWTPLFPNIVVEIDSTMELKKRALECYESQLVDMDYVHTGIGLNAYRSSAVGCKTARFVEAFYSLSLADYRLLHRRVSRFL